MALALAVVALPAAEPASPHLGTTREQLLTRLGEPKSQIAAGDRVIFYYAREKYVLRNDVVIEVEQVAAEVPRRSAPAETPVAPPPAAAAPVAAPGPAPGPAAPVAPPQDLVPTRPAAPAATPGPAPVVQAPVAPPPPDPKVEIKLVRPPSGKDSPASTSAPAPRTETTPVNRPVPTEPRPVMTNPIAPAPAPAPVTGPTPSLKTDARAPAPDDAQAKAFAAAAEREKKAARRRLDEAATAEASPGLFSGKFILLVLVVLGAGGGLLIWRFRQREFELAATSVASTPMPSTPVVAAVPKGDTSIFTAEKLEKLEWKRFEELVAAYYSKTGVVAHRTDAGQEGAVHVKISWKGEPRPFAYVQCVIPTFGPIDPKPLQALLAVLAKDDIRRGHIVTTGKFNAAATKLAEDKQLTLLAGDAFLEKLNALPSSARVEIMKVMSGTVG